MNACLKLKLWITCVFQTCWNNNTDNEILEADLNGAWKSVTFGFGLDTG